MPLQILQNINLQKYNTFYINCQAKYFCIITSLEDLQQAINFANNNCQGKFIILGYGSNILFTKDYQGLIIKNEIKASLDFIETKIENDKEIYITAYSGLSWDSFVEYCCLHNYYGLENLSHIPGTIGAAPIQNIGAYGVEVGDFIESVNVYDLVNHKLLNFPNKECNFVYRHSIFKDMIYQNISNSEIQNIQPFIYSVTFRLSKIKKLNFDYKDISNYLQNNSLNPNNSDFNKSFSFNHASSSKNSSFNNAYFNNKVNLNSGNSDILNIDALYVRNMIIDIRNSKLPDWRAVGAPGSAGSFFKNPIINKQKLVQVLQKYPRIVYYEIKQNTSAYNQDLLYKLSAAYIIDKILNLKSYSTDNVSLYHNQSLVIVNHNQKASGLEIYNFAQVIIVKCREVLNIDLEIEVNIIDY